MIIDKIDEVWVTLELFTFTLPIVFVLLCLLFICFSRLSIYTRK